MDDPNSNYSYVWSTGGIVNGASNLFAGVYSVTVSDEHGCSWPTEFIINDSGSPSNNILSTPVSCNGGCDGEIALSASGGQAPFTYQWNDAANQTSALASGLCAGNYLVTITGRL